MKRLREMFYLMKRFYPQAMCFNSQFSCRAAKFLDFNIVKRKSTGERSGYLKMSMSYKSTNKFVMAMVGSNSPNKYLEAAIHSYVWRSVRRNDQRLDRNVNLKLLKYIFKSRMFQPSKIREIKYIVMCSHYHKLYLKAKVSGNKGQMRRNRNKCRRFMCKLSLLTGNDTGLFSRRRWWRLEKGVNREHDNYITLQYDNVTQIHTLLREAIRKVYGTHYPVALKTYRNILSVLNCKSVVSKKLSSYMLAHGLKYEG